MKTATMLVNNQLWVTVCTNKAGQSANRIVKSVTKAIREQNIPCDILEYAPNISHESIYISSGQLQFGWQRFGVSYTEQVYAKAIDKIQSYIF